ncbi:MAG: NEW3 domain-containing protein [Candidatus Bathyarchaeia archaeon]
MKRKHTTIMKILMCLLSAAALLSTYAPVQGLSQSTTVQGIVADADGIGLSDATVVLYTPSGGLVTSTRTNSYGDFVLPMVEFGTYSLHVTAVGYTEVVKTITVDIFGQNLGTITLPAALSLSASILSLTASVGSQITIPFTVGNAGKDSEVVSFSVSTPAGWSARVLNSNFEVNRVSLSSGQNLALQLEVTIPSAAAAGVEKTVAVTAMGTTNATLTFSVSPRTESAASAVVTGRVVDENNNGMTEVTVDCFSPDGAFLKSVKTSTDGSFTVELPLANGISIQISKDGYSRVTKTVSLKTENQEVILGEIVLQKAVRLTASVTSTVASPGHKVLLPFTVANAGAETETVGFTVSVPKDFSARILDSSGHVVTGTSLSANANSNLQLEVIVPLSANGVYNLTLNAVAKTASSLGFTVAVEPTNESVLSCQFPGKSAAVGGTVRFQVALTNPFSDEMRFKISVDSVPANWTASVKTASGDYVTETTLAGNEVVNLIVEVASPDSAATEEIHTLLVKAQSDAQNQTWTVPLTVSLSETEEVTEGVSIATKFHEVAVEAGNAVQYTITLKNVGNTSRYLLLSAELPTGWKGVFKSGSLEVTQIYMANDTSDTLTFEVTPPSTVGIGNYTIPVQVMSENGEVLTAIDLKTTIVGAYDLSLSLSTYLTSMDSGGSTSFTATVSNTGYSTITGVVLEATMPESDWEYTVAPVQVGTLGPKESATFTVTVKTPDSTVQGDYMVTLQASSDQASSDSMQVRVTVSTSTSWGIYGVGVAVTFVVVLVLVFRKFKRR